MTKNLSLVAFVLGAAVVIWMGSGFVGSNLLAMMVTVLIGGAFTLGFVELLRFQAATRALEEKLSGVGSAPPVLTEWLDGLPASLRNTVRKRIQDEPAGLPAPVLTPYLVGLLVMLGLLGTFIGMVETLSGAVQALEGTTDLEAIRAGLAQPIQGLGMAFATSVAGVTSSAMLGFISTISRRERIAVSQLLDEKVRTVFADYSLSHNREQTYRAIQAQAEALPDIAANLATLVEQIGGMAEQLKRDSESLTTNLSGGQQALNESVQQSYRGLAKSVEESLKASLAESGRLAGESIQPVIAQVMEGIGEEAAQTQQNMRELAQQQIDALSAQYAGQAEQLAQVWQAALAEQKQAGADTLSQFERGNVQLRDQLETLHVSVVNKMQSANDTQLERQRELEDGRSQLWDAMLRQGGELLVTSGQKLGEAAVQTSEQISTKLAALLSSTEALLDARLATESEWQNRFDARIESLAQVLRQELASLVEIETERGAAAVNRLEQLEQAVSKQLAELGGALEAPMNRLIETASEAPRAAAEVITTLRAEMSNTIERDKGLLAERAGILTDLSALSESLAASAQAQRETVERMLQATSESMSGVADQFNTRIGEGLKTLSESAQAQRETVEKMLLASSESMSQVADQFNTRIGEGVTTLSESVLAQRETVEKILLATNESMAEVTDQFNMRIGEGVKSLSEVVDNFSCSAVELTSLGDAFTQAVVEFGETNTQLMTRLEGIEQALEKSTERSDEQMAYYVAQAREIIDNNMVTQQELMTQLRALSRAAPAQEGA